MMRTAGTQPVANSVAKVNEEVAVGEDLSFQRSWWRFERIVWMVFVIIIALDLAGAFGRGPLAHAEVTSADRELSVRYERIQRVGTPSILSIKIDAGAVREGHATLFVGDHLVNSLGAKRIIPEPATTRLGSGGLTYTFPVTSAPSTVRIELEPAGPGRFPIEISAGSQATTVKAVVWVMP
jgi:hypothetical protein